MNISVNWIDGMLMVGKSDSGHAITMDGPPEIGGANLGVRPMEMMLLGMAGCTMIDVVSTLEKMRENLFQCEFLRDGTQVYDYNDIYSDDPKKFQSIADIAQKIIRKREKNLAH